jgi:hypothetical protein
VRLVPEGGGEYSTQWAAINSGSAKIGCTTETLRVRQAERDCVQRPGPTSAARERVRALELENRELH